MPSPGGASRPRLEERKDHRSQVKKKLGNIIPLLIIVIGLGVLLYPTISNLLFEQNASQAVSSYDETVDSTDEQRREQMLEAARAYNEQLAASSGAVPALAMNGSGNPKDAADYWQLLDVDGTGMMAYIDIPRINQTLPIYHGTDEAVLQVGVGHLPSTSLPVGGESTHVALSGHRGLPTAKLFTDLDQMQLGDVFFIHVLGEALAYEVDDISVVEPDDTQGLAIQEGEDLVTLITCTPYGVNTHRLLIRAHRVPYTPELEAANAPPGGFYIPVPYAILALAVLILALILVIMLIVSKVKKSKRKKAALAAAKAAAAGDDAPIVEPLGATVSQGATTSSDCAASEEED